TAQVKPRDDVRTLAPPKGMSEGRSTRTFSRARPKSQSFPVKVGGDQSRRGRRTDACYRIWHLRRRRVQQRFKLAQPREARQRQEPPIFERFKLWPVYADKASAVAHKSAHDGSPLERLPIP